MAAKRIAGTVYFKIDADQYDVEASLTVGYSTVTRNAAVGLSGVAGYTETARAASIEGTFFTKDKTTAKAMEAVTDATITVEAGDGSIYVLSNAWRAGDMDIDLAAGTINGRFEASSIQVM